MSVLWLIIKIILILLLVIFCMALVVVGVVLFAPIRYEAYFAKYEEVTYDIKVSYLIGIKGLFYLNQEKKNHKITIFGKVLYKNETIDVPETSGKEDTASPNHNVSDSIGAFEVPKNVSKEAAKEVPRSRQDKIKPSEAQKQQQGEVKKKVNTWLKKEAEKSVEHVQERLEDETVETIKHMPIAWAKALLLNKVTYLTVREVVKSLWRIGRYVFPNEWDFEVVIGEGDPADTGEMIAKLTMLYPLYYRHGIIRGAYDRECLEGGFLARGKFRIGKILGYIIACLLHKQVRSFIRSIMVLRKEEKNGK